jgi:beta-glucanase (GH16 family)
MSDDVDVRRPDQNPDDPYDRPPLPRRRRRLRSVWSIVLPIGVGLILAAAIGAVTILTSGPLDQKNSADNGHPTGSAGSPNGSGGPSASGPATVGPSATRTSTPAGGCSFIVTEGVCPIAPPLAAAAGKRWQIGFAAEFTGDSIDGSKLTPCFDWNSGDCTSSFNNGREHYMPSQVVVSNGTAKLIAAPLNPPFANNACQNGSCTYKAGLLSTARPLASAKNYLYTFKYGYVESRFKFPATQGFFTAFWMLPADPTYNYQYEIDILEMLGDDPTTMYMTYSYNGRNSSYPVNNSKGNNGACAVKDYSKEFVRMGMDWEPDHVAWYIDGHKCGEFKGTGAQIANTPMQLILHMMVDNDWERRWNVGLTDPTLTRQLEVDYIRVYQQIPA